MQLRFKENHVGLPADAAVTPMPVTGGVPHLDGPCYADRYRVSLTGVGQTKNKFVGEAI